MASVKRDNTTNFWQWEMQQNNVSDDATTIISDKATRNNPF